MLSCYKSGKSGSLCQKPHFTISRLNKEHKHDVKIIRTEPDTNKLTYEEEKVALILGTTAVFTVWWMFK